MSAALPIGSRRLNHNGYVLIKTADGWRFEHRVVWESIHGALASDKVIHHINHDRTDNRIENLEACSNGTHIATYHADHSRRQALINAANLKGVKRSEAYKAALRVRLRGLKKPPRTKDHTAKVSEAMRRLWQRRCEPKRAIQSRGTSSSNPHQTSGSRW